MNRDLALETWDKFIKNDCVDLSVLDQAVVNSWNRCKALQLDPYKNDKTRIQGAEFEQRKLKIKHAQYCQTFYAKPL